MFFGTAALNKVGINRLEKMRRPEPKQPSNRFSCLIPRPTTGIRRVPAGWLRLHHALIAMQADADTCCIKITNENRKSRGVLLVFRGRVLGALYKQRLMAEHITGQTALEYIMQDMADPATMLETWNVDEGVALASGSLFHGQCVDYAQEEQPLRQLDELNNYLINSRLPGCIMVQDGFGKKRLGLYYLDGVLQAVYSFEEGFLRKEYRTAVDAVSRIRSPALTLYYLECNSLSNLYPLTLSLTTAIGNNHDEMRWLSKHQSRQSGFENWTERPTLQQRLKVQALDPHAEHERALRVFATSVVRMKELPKHPLL